MRGYAARCIKKHFHFLIVGSTLQRFKYSSERRWEQGGGFKSPIQIFINDNDRNL